MKVLMLGWEFPPHISGGLGTACAGITQALENENVDVLFVVPKLHGGERADRTTFINASTIPVRQKKVISEDQSLSLPAVTPSTYQATNSNQNSTAENKGSRAVIEVSSFLLPYTAPVESENPYNLQQWNYSFTDQGDRTVPANLRSPYNPKSNQPRRQVQYVHEPYQFSGTYGADLISEVDRYAQVSGEIARRNQFDVIHAHDWITYRAGISAKKVSGKPLVVHVHATEIDRSGTHVNQTIFGIEKEGMLQADKVVAVSHWTKNIAVQHYGIPSEKIEVIHNGISPKDSATVDAAIAPPLGSKIITFLGRITQQKGPMYFVEAARKVHEQFPDAHFVVAGAGDQLPMMIERIAQLRLSGQFHFTGFLRGDDIDRIWAMSSVYVMPSVSEPFGIAPLEAIQAGVPVILSKQAGVSEVMPHAIKVDFWNCEAFAEAICNVIRFRSLANTLKKNGVEEIKNITWDKAAKKLTTLYHELSNKYEKREESGIVLSGSPTKKTARAAFF